MNYIIIIIIIIIITSEENIKNCENRLIERSYPVPLQ